MTRGSSRPRYRDELRAVLDSMLEGVIAVDGRGRIIHMNAGAELLACVGADDAVGRKLGAVVDLDAVRDVAERVLAGGGPEAALVRRKRGVREDVIQVRAAPLKGKGDKLAGAVIVFQDISELERLATVRQEFISNASHELKTPVTAILGLIETLVDTPDVDADTHDQFLVRIRDQARRLRALVSDLLTLSRLESPQSGFVTEPVDLTEPVRDAYEALLTLAQAKNIALTGAWPRGPVIVEADREGLRQAATNLIDNAIKYTPAGGRVAVRVLAALDLKGRPVGRLEVEDTGIGIAPADQERVFERFYRVDRARSRDAGGTGLGLAIVKHITRATGGEIELTSVPGRGSAFRLWWPRLRTRE